MKEYDDVIKSKELSVYIKMMLVIMLLIIFPIWMGSRIFSMDSALVVGEDFTTYNRLFSIFVIIALFISLGILFAVFHVGIMIILWFIIRSPQQCLYCAREFQSDTVETKFDKDTNAYIINCPHCGRCLGYTRSLRDVLHRPPAV